MTDYEDTLKLVAKDLAKDFPPSPRETLAGFVTAIRTLGKYCAVLADTAGK